MTTYIYGGMEHDESEYELMLYNIMHEHDYCYMREFKEWLHSWVDDNASKGFAWEWSRTIQDLWYEFVVEYTNEHDREIMERFGVEKVEE